MVGGTTADEAQATYMFQAWITCVDMDWGSIINESNRRNKLACLLEMFQREPCCRFWLFLRQMRMAQISGHRDLELGGFCASLDEESFLESEDFLTLSQFSSAISI